MENNSLVLFESLGNNCEFGFYLRSKGIDDGSLFRWSFIHNYAAINMLIKNKFNSFFNFDSIIPYSDTMVFDQSISIAFHSCMHSHIVDNKRVFLESNEKIKLLYAEEKNKYKYLVGKFLYGIKKLKKTYIIKENDNNIDLSVIKDISYSMNAIGPSRILVIFSTKDSEKLATFERYSEHILISYIDRFSDYTAAEKISEEGWNNIINNCPKF